MKKEDIEDLFYIVENNLLKKDSIFVLSDGRLLFCNPEMATPYIGGNSHKNPIRISAKTGNIEIYYKRFMEFPFSGRFWLLAWAFCRFDSSSEAQADIKASEVYLKNFNKKTLIPDFLNLIKYAPSDANRERLKQLQLQFLKSKSK
jgi:hypothetical protein